MSNTYFHPDEISRFVYESATLRVADSYTDLEISTIASFHGVKILLCYTWSKESDFRFL